ncbi:ATP-binding cassette domain-containing protein [Paenibacillus gallinarum]|uniref:ABC transporter ATP-binding protein n=1 Tax=Paenibacillus gallinarum TaxID=2762232 RepID=A0ABR8SUZ1_9BACL|nr:ATP-binding cassette domain-containing protein [Paenibacillus gallinarum]MBD7967310.1 ABC transporter ATP-binding protein [Paenibacillus gallinarum]
MVIQLDEVSKRYGEKVVISDVSLQINQGECLVLMGDNGSGKTTLLRLLAGLIYPTEGKVLRKITGGTKKTLIRRTGYAIDRLPVTNFTAEDYLLAMGLMQGLSKKETLYQTGVWFELFGLMEDKNELIASYSKGMRQKVNIMQSLLGDPELLLLDEPLSGLDRNSQKNLIQLLSEYKKTKMTLVCASHEQLIVSELADRVVEMHRGKLIRLLQPEEIVTVDTTLVRVTNLSEADAKILSTAEGIIELSTQSKKEAEPEITIIMHSSHSDILLAQILAKGGSIQSVTREEK